MRKKKNFRRKPKKQLQGLQIDVYDGNVEFAIRKFKKMVKESNLMLDLRKKSYYEKPSKLSRERKNLSKLRNKYQEIKKNY